VHDAELHPGDGMPFQMALQRLLCRNADAVGALTAHVAVTLRAQGLAGTRGRPLVRVTHPPMSFDGAVTPVQTQGPRRLLCFGRLLTYKGLDLLAAALAILGPREDLVVRVVGTGPESGILDKLRALPRVTVENRWVPEDEVGALFGWADGLVLPYREASQSGVAAAALAAGRPVVATRVGGLVEQLAGRPGVWLCEPTAASIAAALCDLLAAPRGLALPVDAQAAWGAMAASLVQQIEPLAAFRSKHPALTVMPV
jgi:glycosyltransferase involved in cell wall biosynthesis